MTQLRPGSPFDVGSNRDCARRIEEYYHKKGFVFATVELEKGDNRSDREVVFQINEGPRVHVSKVTIDGDEKSVDGIPDMRTRTKTCVLALLGDNDNLVTIDGGIEAIKEYYHRLGYFDAEIQRRRSSSDNKSTAQFEYEIDEGVRYKIRTIEVCGLTVVGDAEIREILTSTAGSFYRGAEVNRDVNAIKRMYERLGLPLTRVDAVPRWAEEKGLIDLVFKIAPAAEGPVDDLEDELGIKYFEGNDN